LWCGGPEFDGGPNMFRPIYIISDLWQHTGWNSIIFLAALAAVDPSLYESAMIDGASKWKRILYIDLPSIAPTCVIMLILSVGNILNVGFDKAFLMQNPLNSSTSEIISTYVYKIGIINTQYSMSAAVGLFNNVINFVLLISVNWFSRKLTETSLW
ncbi:MAG: ABC transporter permease subunit, partial [Eubacterium sp.]